MGDSEDTDLGLFEGDLCCEFAKFYPNKSASSFNFSVLAKWNLRQRKWMAIDLTAYEYEIINSEGNKREKNSSNDYALLKRTFDRIYAGIKREKGYPEIYNYDKEVDLPRVWLYESEIIFHVKPSDYGFRD